jgi:hypothetical protein
MSPNDPRVAKRQAVLALAGYTTMDNGHTYHRQSYVLNSKWYYETHFPYSRFVLKDEYGYVQDAWDQSYGKE